MDLAFIIKGTAVRKGKLSRSIDRMASRLGANSCKVYRTNRPHHAPELARAAVEDGDTHIIAIGGDGTAHEVLNGMMAATQRPLPFFGILSNGQANDFVRTAELTGGLKQLERLLETESYKRIDAGKVYYSNSAGQPESRWFLNIADLGLGASVVQKVKKLPGRVPASLAYYPSIMATLLHYRNVPVSYKTTESDWTGKTKMLAIANGCCFGNGTWIAPQAELDDGKFHLVCIGDVSLRDYLQHLPQLNNATVIDDPRIRYVATDVVEVDAIPGTLPLEADGEFLGYAPARFEVVPGALRLLCELD